MRNSIRFVLRGFILLLAVPILTSSSLVVGQTASPPATQPRPIALPAPQTTGGMPLMQALANRKTSRTFTEKPLSMQQLSNLLWASFGVNRQSMLRHDPLGGNRPPAAIAAPGPAGPGGQNAPDPGGSSHVQHTQGRTAPSAMNSQDIDLYVATPSGAYLYDAVNNRLKPVASGDVRAQITSAAAAKAAVTIVFVAPAQADRFAQVDTGFIGQDAYLFAASEGLNAWFYAIPGASALSAISTALKLDADCAPLYEQSIGYPRQ